MKERKHKDLIIAWANDPNIQIEMKNIVTGKWEPCSHPLWDYNFEYRIKPQEDLYKDLEEAIKQGKTIQMLSFNEMHWLDLNLASNNVSPKWTWSRDRYRIKPEPKLKLVPFTWETASSLRNKWVKQKSGDNEYCVVSITREHVYLANYGSVKYSTLLGEFEFINRTPCGKYIEV